MGNFFLQPVVNSIAKAPVHPRAGMVYLGPTG